MITMLRKKLVYFTLVTVLLLPLSSVMTTTAKDYIEVEYFIGGLRLDHPPTAERQIALYNDLCEKALDYGIKINLVYAEVPFSDELYGRLMTGEYDILEGFYYTTPEDADNFETILGTLEGFFIDGFVRYDTEKHYNIIEGIMELRALYDEYLIASPENQEQLMSHIIHRFHRIEKLLYKSQIIQYLQYFTLTEPFAGLIWQAIHFYNSEPGNVLHKKRVRLIISSLIDRDAGAILTSLMPYPFAEVIPTCNLFSWSQYHDTGLPDTPPVHGWF
jgi:hypothetical protein